MRYTIALAGNPNSGKTTLFNELTGSHQHVGNWPGVTVEKKDGYYRKDRNIAIIDLPGTYSLSPYSAEEKIARRYIVEEKPDAVIDIIDGTNIERNLYLALQILETGIPTVLAVNMKDELALRGDKIDYELLGSKLGCPVVSISARKDKDFAELMTAVQKIAGNRHTGYQKCWTDGDTEERIADKRYKFISGICRETVRKGQTAEAAFETKSDKLDKILTNKWLALPIFAAVMYVMFALVFSENLFGFEGVLSPANYLVEFVAWLWGFASDGVAYLIRGTPVWLQGLVNDGIMGGIDGVLSFLPLVLVLYILLSFLEDAGYIARVAFVLDRVFRKFGLSGRSFIPLLMGWGGCSVPGIAATRTLPSEKDRKITTILCGFMPCGAKLPIFAMFISIFFNKYAPLAMFAIYMASLVVSIIVSLVLNKINKAETSAFIMELPQYRWPTLKSVLIHAWEKIRGFAVKAGKIIILAGILIWALQSFNFDSFNGKNYEASKKAIAEAQAAGEDASDREPSNMCEADASFLAGIAHPISYVFRPLGFGGTIHGHDSWKPTVGVITGWIAKEMVVVTFSELYPEISQDVDDTDYVGKGSAVLTAHEVIAKDFVNPAAVWAYMLFNMFCMPCFAAVGATRQELGSGKETLKAISIQMLTGYIVGLVVFLVGSLFYV
ncbi:MAG: ferrous iron transport protein B [Treponema sp.]|jgi:ferrous iron transport protein B|nr:ferrous iron transport protein B [Treponema sp.]